MEKYKSVLQYLSTLPEDIQFKVEELRETIRQAAPEATEVISYNMPAYKMNKVLVYFAVYRNHIGFYPTGSGIAAFQKEIAAYKNSKGAVQFPINEKLPLALVSRMVKFRLEADAEEARLKAEKRKKTKQ